MAAASMRDEFRDDIRGVYDRMGKLIDGLAATNQSMTELRGDLKANKEHCTPCYEVVMRKGGGIDSRVTNIEAESRTLRGVAKSRTMKTIGWASIASMLVAAVISGGMLMLTPQGKQSDREQPAPCTSMPKPPRINPTT